jgi:hypothetical protein
VAAEPRRAQHRRGSAAFPAYRPTNPPNKEIVMPKILSRILPLVAAAALALAGSGTAHAAPTVKVCTVSSFAYDEAPRLIINCSDGFSAYSFLTGTVPGCQSRTLDTIKIWESIAMSMLLSSKHASITYEPAGSACGVNSIYAIQAGP